MTEPSKNLVIAYRSYYYCSARTVQFSLHIQDLFFSIGFGVITTVLTYSYIGKVCTNRTKEGEGGGVGLMVEFSSEVKLNKVQMFI